MSFFSSRRERRLWLWVLAVMVAIYATLGLAQQWAAALEERGLLDFTVGLFLLCMLLVGLTVLTQGLRVRPGGAEVAVFIGVATAYLLVLTRMTVPTERSHLIEYSIVGVLIHEALTERRSRGRRVPLPPVLAVLITVALGALDEGIQWLLPNRVFDPVDILFNTLAGTMAVAASVALTWARRRTALQRFGLK
ncbi:MAG: VanZ family protein [Chloroflexota bacterium]|nr:VanZ family protein [Chloroflexota bacterium]MDE2931535.1 VanZ family protein [Chloroflexota bacterium]